MGRAHVYAKKMEGICEFAWTYELGRSQLVDLKLTGIVFAANILIFKLTHRNYFILFEDFIHKRH